MFTGRPPQAEAPDAMTAGAGFPAGDRFLSEAEGVRMTCDRHATCSFFAEFHDNSIRRQYQLFVKSYCRGTLQSTCRRLLYERSHGATPPDNLCPNGFLYRSTLGGRAASAG